MIRSSNHRYFFLQWETHLNAEERSKIPVPKPTTTSYQYWTSHFCFQSLWQIFREKKKSDFELFFCRTRLLHCLVIILQNTSTNTNCRERLEIVCSQHKAFDGSSHPFFAPGVEVLNVLSDLLSFSYILVYSSFSVSPFLLLFVIGCIYLTYPNFLDFVLGSQIVHIWKRVKKMWGMLFSRLFM